MEPSARPRGRVTRETRRSHIASPWAFTYPRVNGFHLGPLIHRFFMTDEMWSWYVLVSVVAIGMCLAAIVATSVILWWP